MTGPARTFLRSRPTAQPSGATMPPCYRSASTDDGAACHLCYEPDTQQALLRIHPGCTGCRAGQWAARLYYADRTRP